MIRIIRRRLVVVAATLGVITLAVLEAQAGAGEPLPWGVYVQAVDSALARGDHRAARDAWQSAYAMALASGRWEGLASVGDASTRIGDSGGEPDDLARARQAYREAFVHARSEGSIDGVLRLSAAYSRLGDHELARAHRDTAVRLAVRQASPNVLTRIWAKLTRR